MRYNRMLCAVAAFVFASMTSMAQVDSDIDDPAFDDFIDQSDFDAFQRRAEQRFSAYADSIDARFARELLRQWSEFEVHQGVRRKPMPEPEPAAVPADLDVPLPLMDGEPETDSTSAPAPARRPVQVPAPLPSTGFVWPTPKAPQHLPPVGLPTPSDEELLDGPSFTFFGQRVVLPTAARLPQLGEVSSHGVAQFWEALSALLPAVGALDRYAKDLSLHGWGVYMLMAQAAGALYPSNSNAQAVFVVYALNHLGYDARVALSGGELLCAVHIDEQLYATTYVAIAGKNYYLFYPNQPRREPQGSLRSYEATYSPNAAAMQVALHELPRFVDTLGAPVRHSAGKRTSQIGVERHLSEFYATFPQVDVVHYANAPVSKSFATQAARQFAPMVANSDTLQALRKLLNFVQFAFEYATDDEQFGYEKPFFCEENYVYPANDCEDRSVLFAYIVRQVLGLDVVLLEYPGHIATAVALGKNTPVGDYYMVQGRRYTVCDPTYIGADVGKSQQAYENVRAQIVMIEK